MKSLTVELGERSYPILIGRNLLAQAGLLARHVRGRRALVVTDSNVAPRYLQPVLGALGELRVDPLILPAGEHHKTLATVQTIFDALLAGAHDRATTLIALGGGVVGDMTGFAAACYQRGVDFIQLPTTLLAQVDSSVGGKTGVNHPRGKNMIGAFHQPRAVLIDIATLATLPAREFRAGMAEVIKYGLIADADFFTWLEANAQALLARDDTALMTAIARSCRCKAAIVGEDEREGGVRALLNFGHTFGHAIETAQNYTDWLHGEAVAAGMVIASELSRRLGWITARDSARIRALLTAFGLPVAPPPGLSAPQFMALMAVDKKVADGVIRLVLLRGIGGATLSADYDPQQLAATLAGVG